MLVLSRKASQRIKLGESIVVTVIRVSGEKVRLGIEAPADVLVLREELEPQPRVNLLPVGDEPTLVLPAESELLET
ncbi:MAG: carbon storage regulator [Pirellulales bacterium]